jgi:hypothetical protein
LDDFLKDSNELDLWAFDEIEPVEEKPVKPPSRSSSSDIPAPREARKKKAPEPEAPFPEKTLGSRNSIQVNVSSKDPRPKSQSTGAPMKSKPGDDFDDLDHWDEPDSVAPLPEIEPEIPSEPAVPKESVVESVEPEITPPVVAAVIAGDVDEFSPVVPENATPISLVPHLGLSKVERIGLWALLGVLLIGGGILYFATIHRLPTETVRVRQGDFPVKGRHLTILSADTFWRAPIMEGPNVETFRRGTQLLPVVTLAASGGPAAVRLFFRNEDGLVMGDAVTRTIQSGVPLEIAATAGFEDVGMHAAYRTGQSKPWTIEVFEAPAATSPNPDFKKLFEIDISTDRR